jgi:tetratricopeptide (TPR) repeat protein
MTQVANGSGEGAPVAGAAREAQYRKDWSRALELWEACLRDQPKDRDVPDWRHSRALALSELGRHQEAEDAYRSLAEDYPDLAAPIAGLARLAQIQRNWPEACRLWNACLERFPSHGNALGWRTSLGAALIERGNYAEAENVYQALATERPDAAAGLSGLARTAMRQHRWADALAHWDGVIERFGAKLEPNWLAGRAAVLIELGRFDEGEQALRAMADRAELRMGALTGLAHLATRRGRWSEALEWWEMLRGEPGGQLNPSQMAQRAGILVELGQLDEAEEILCGLAGQPGLENFLAIRQATILVRRKKLPDALTILDSVLAHCSDVGQRLNATALRARVLYGLGRLDEAESMYRELCRDRPGHLEELLQILSVTGRPAEALELLDSISPDSPERPQLISKRFICLVALRRLREARTVFDRAMEGTEDPAVLTCLFEFAPPLFEGWDRTKRWLAMLEKIDRLERGRGVSADPSLSALRLRLFLALRNHEGFLTLFDQVKDSGSLGAHRANLHAAAHALRNLPFPDFKRPKIFGIGLSKTGTTSLASALAMLGLATVDWVNRLTGEMMSDDDLHLFDAFTDTPCCIDFEGNYYKFPNSKFIYNFRQPQEWEHSWGSHLKRHYSLSSFQDAKRRMMDKDEIHHGTKHAGIYMSLYFNHADYAEAFQTYDRRVRQFFADKPKERFLEFNVFAGDSWEKLCAFLDCDIPSVPFPWDNRAPPAKRSNTD